MIIQLDSWGEWVAIFAGLIIGISTISAFLWKFFIKPSVVVTISETTNCPTHTRQLESKADISEIKKINEKLEENAKMMENLANVNSVLIRNLERSIEADKHILQGIFACLDGLRQLDCNGNVSASYKDMQDYLIGREDMSLKF